MASWQAVAETFVETLRGSVSVKALGPEKGATFLALGGLSRRGWGPDWIAAGVADALAKKHRVILPDAYSNPSTAPSGGDFAVLLTLRTLGGFWRGACRETWLLDLLPKPSPGRPVVLAGHSWGGGAAARLAAVHPERVSRLVLVSPDVEWSVARRCWGTPTLLLWARDDVINPILWTSRWRGHPNLTIHRTDKGGHRVLESHAEVIAQWLDEQDAREAAAAAGAVASAGGAVDDRSSRTAAGGEGEGGAN